MASSSGYGAEGPARSISHKLQATDLPSKCLLGKGLASIVYETEWKGLRCARKDFIGVPSDIFEAEAGVLVRLQHDNIAKTHGWTVDKMSCSLVEEYVEDDLLGLLQHRKKSQGSPAGIGLELREALQVMSQTARAMEYLHGKGIIHGDLKTNNILVTQVNDGGKDLLLVKVTDFGLTRTKRKSIPFVSRPVRKLDMVQWKAPEYFKRPLSDVSEDNDESSESDSSNKACTSGSLDLNNDRLRFQACDTYSFAVTCYQILTGKEPYPNWNWKTLGARIMQDDLRPKLPASCPDLLVDLLVHCWDKDPMKRPTFTYISKTLEAIQLRMVPSVRIHSMRRHAQNCVNGSGSHSETSSADGTGNSFEGNSSSSHPVVESEKYDVFINHRGPDTKLRFVNHLEEALKLKHISPFVDESLKVGKHAFEEIKAAIRTPPVQVAIFSPHYAESRYCLDELVDMLKREKEDRENVTFLPIFFNVKPGDLRNPFGYDSFCKAFKNHKNIYPDERISNWIKALNDAAQFKGFDLSKLGGDERELKHKIVTRVQEILQTINSASRPPEPPSKDFTPGSLRVLVLGNSDSVEDIVSHICGAGRRQTEVTGYEGLTESRSASPPMCLYYNKAEGSDRNDFMNVVKAFVDDRNSRWHGKQVVTVCLDVVYRRRKVSADLFPGSALRLHMVWYVCQKISDLPDSFLWKEIKATLCDIPLQIVVTAAPGPPTPDSKFRRIFEQKIRLFPEAQKPEELVVEFDMNLIEDLWRKCCEAKTRGEIRNAVRVIREVQKELGKTRISIPQGVGKAAIPPNVSLLVGGEFLLRDFFCNYWEVPSLASIDGVLKDLTTFIEQTPDGTYRYRIQRGQFVKFCLQVAAVILHNLRDSDGNPRSVSDQWPTSFSDPSYQLLKTGIDGCYARYFQRNDHTYEKMKFNAIQELLQSIFERRDFDFELLEGQERACCFCWSL